MKRILVLEDEPALMNLVGRMLSRYAIVEAANPEQAIRRFREHDGCDLLIADVNLPAISGIQVALLLRAEDPDLPVILASGFPTANWSEQELIDLARLGSHSLSVLQKPFSSAMLRARVAQLIGSPHPDAAHTA